jgi:hypothetical protein
MNEHESFLLMDASDPYGCHFGGLAIACNGLHWPCICNGTGLHCRGKHRQWMNVVDDPGSKNTFHKIQDRSAPILSAIIMLNGVGRLVHGSSTFSDGSSICSGFSSSSSLMMMG